MKKLLLILLTLLSSSSIFAYSGLMSGQEGKLRIAKTKYFDIIYTEKSEQTANILYEKADSVFEELSELYLVPHPFRTTISITPSTDEFNAMYTAFPFNSICIYDTPPEKSMLVFSDSVLNTFRHELIHAFTFNSKNTFWYTIGKIFGDPINPLLLTAASTGLLEGATVSTESNHGEGRMNSEMNQMLLRQAKIEGKFPKYSEIQGARDIFPSDNVSYHIGGAFAEYIQKKYGFDKYAQFWYNACNIQKPSYLFYFTNFKSVYGISIKDAWKDFYDSIEVPDVKKRPWEEDWCTLVEKPSYINKSRDNFSTVASSPKGFAFFDSYKQKIIYVTNNGKSRTLVNASSVSKLNFSPDGKFLTFSYKSSNNNNIKNHVSIINLENHSQYTFRENSLKDGAIFKSGENYYVAAVKTESQKTSLRIYKIIMNEKGFLKDVEALKDFEAPFGDVIFSLSGAENGKLFFVYKQLLNFQIYAYNLEENNFYKIQIADFNPENDKKEIFQLNSSIPGKISFSYTQKGSLVRLGILDYNQDFSKVSVLLSAKDSSGGIFDSSLFDDGKKVLYAGHFFEDHRLLVADIDKMEFQTSSADAIPSDSDYFSSKTIAIDADKQSVWNEFYSFYVMPKEKTEEEKLPVEKNSKHFSLTAYTFTGPHGIIMPFSLCTSTAFVKQPNNTYITESTSSLLGISYASSTPWTNPIYILSFGYNPFSNSVNFHTTLSSSENHLSYLLQGNVEFDTSGFKQTFGSLSLQKITPFLFNTYLALSSSSEIFYGRQNKQIKNEDILNLFSSKNPLSDIFGFLKDENSANYFYAEEFAYIGLVNNKRDSSDVNSHYGSQALSFFKGTFFNKTNTDTPDLLSFGTFGFDFLLRIPRLLPFHSYNYTLNLPTDFDFQLFPSQSYFASAKAKITLFSAEIQKSTNWLPLFYFNRFTISSSYTGKFTENITEPLPSFAIKNTSKYMNILFSGNAQYYDELALSFSLEANPNLGGLSRNQFKFEIQSELYFRFNPIPNQSNFGMSVFGIVLF